MSTKNRYPPAFPRPAVYHPERNTLMDRGFDGMNLRDYFAAASLPGVMKATYETADEHAGEEAWDDPTALVYTIACVAYDIADAMLQRREIHD